VYAAWASDRAVMYITNNYFNDTYGFHNTTAHSTQGNDRAVFYDSAGNDVYTAWSNRATMSGPRSEEHTSELQSRENLVCRLLLSPTPATYPRPLLDALPIYVYAAWASDRAVMYITNNYFNDTYGFHNTTAHSTQGNDRAVFYDSAGNDVYTAWSNRATMSGP